MCPGVPCLCCFFGGWHWPVCFPLSSLSAFEAFEATRAITELTALDEPSDPEAAAAPTAASSNKVAVVMLRTSSRVNPRMPLIEGYYALLTYSVKAAAHKSH